MTHWQNFYHDATAEELDDFVSMFHEIDELRPWLKDESRSCKLAHMRVPRRFLLRTRPVVVC
jgi:hypothetical protein